MGLAGTMIKYALIVVVIITIISFVPPMLSHLFGGVFTMIDNFFASMFAPVTGAVSDLTGISEETLSKSLYDYLREYLASLGIDF